MNGKVWLIGGTSDSATIAKILMASSLPLVITVATANATSLYSSVNQVAVGCMDADQMTAFCQQRNIVAVVDASHPYAVEVSRQAIAVTTALNIPYLRYERVGCSPSAANTPILELDSFDTLIAGDYLREQQVLLTVGCKALPLFKSWQERATLYARVLPNIASIETALAAGFKSDRLIAIRPPLSFALETALWQQWNISLVVTKASGTAGGEDIKRQVAANLNVPLIVITRPQIIYPQQTSEFPEVLAFCRQV
ncbi:cobalt-precorrin-6A reductase [Pleurocapsales cyanobacterium LEGE 10410]|nr:cobalt-precorrin-6A reductase [Pleurocapsales cyanobacterium LEGE 10410]